ncbi:MAG: VWA domain-containing protein [Candidatus Sulfomarinibacteraceae bacterium]
MVNRLDGTTHDHRTPGSPGDQAAIFLGFFYRLRSHGLKVTPQQWLTVIEGLAKGLHGSSLIGFYSLARGVLVKDESELDDFDVCFAEHFGGSDHAAASIEREVWDWLENPVPPFALDPSRVALLDALDVDTLREELESRLREQDERHDRGDRWIGTGGTSPFGHSGAHPGGIRVGGEGGGRSAVQVAGERRYREHRRDVILDTRQLSVALTKLRALERTGPADELDLEGTIERTARGGGELDLVFEAPRKNRLSLLLAMDVGGSMWPYRELVDLLFSAAHRARHFKRFDHVYFHNCIYERVYSDAGFHAPIPLKDLFRRFDRETRLVLVGDAHMYPGEITDRFGAIDWTERNEQPGIVYLTRIRDHFRRCAWLNPMGEAAWSAPSTRLIRGIFPMYPLTVRGVEELARDLAK